MEQSFKKEAIQEPFTVEEFGQFIKSFRTSLIDLPSREAEKEAVENFVQSLVESKERFASVFKTSRNSTYFHLQSGQTVRFKYVDYGDGPVLRPQPMTKELFFLKQEDALRIAHNEFGPEVGKQIVVAKYEIGSHPIEFDFEGHVADRIVYEKNEQGFVVKGAEVIGVGFTDKKDEMMGIYHIGHPVAEIIK